MWIDADSLEPGARLESAVCVIGAGAAGIALGLELARSGVDVCLLESGGPAFDAATQDLYAGEVTGRGYFPLNVCRLRWLGGTTNHWSGHCPELDASVLGARSWISAVGWPFPRATLDAFYPRAARMLEVTAMPFAFGPDEAAPARRSLPIATDRFTTRLMRFSPPARMGAFYRDELTASPRVRLVLHANAVRIQRARGSAEIERVAVRTLSGKDLTLIARHYVLATGGIENARLLLASNDLEPAGLGNGHDLVGRHFMDQLVLPDGARWLLASERRAIDLYRWPEGGGRGSSVGVLGLASAAAERERIGDLMLRLNWSSEARDSDGWRALRELRAARRKGRRPDDLGDAVWKIMRDLDDVAAGTYEELFGLGEGAYAEFLCESEQRPEPANRVTLMTERDALGVPRARLHWTISDEDFRTIERGLRLAALAIGAAELGRVQLALDETWRDRVAGAFHHLGTTRMAETASAGVVDPRCRVHGLANLWVAGSSVFPTGGASNPTLTIVALALRLADELKGRLAA